MPGDPPEAGHLVRIAHILKKEAENVLKRGLHKRWADVQCQNLRPGRE